MTKQRVIGAGGIPSEAKDPVASRARHRGRPALSHDHRGGALFHSNGPLAASTFALWQALEPIAA